MYKYFLLISFFLSAFYKGHAQSKPYLYYIQNHCDHLLQFGQDRSGPVTTNFLASVIDTRDMIIPKSGVPATEGTRSHDRAVGGSNFYHHVETIKVLEVLSEITNDPKYRQAVDHYAIDLIEYAQNPHTGLLAWGEHLYYNFYADSVMVGDLSNPRDAIYHEFLAETPPWPLLWETNATATERAISGIRFHFRSPVTQSFLYNRHARWDRVDKKEYRNLQQYQDGGQPWIKHSGLQAYSFAFLYHQTKDPEWIRWTQGVGNLYWKYRNPTTNLTPSCIDDPRPNSQRASINSMALLSYYLLKVSKLDPEFQEFHEKAETMLKSIYQYSWNPEEQNFHSTINLDGSVFDKSFVPVVHTGYGGSDILTFGRVAVYFYRETQDPEYLEMVKQVNRLLLKTAWPDHFVINSLASTLQYALDAYEVTGDLEMYEKARQLADIGIDKLWSGKMFIRQPGDPYYEAKLGTGGFLMGLMRLHLLATNQANRFNYSTWSF